MGDLAAYRQEQIERLIEENKRLREACTEAYLFVTAPLNSPRLWPTSRGNLTKMLEKALGDDKPIERAIEAFEHAKEELDTHLLERLQSRGKPKP